VVPKASSTITWRAKPTKLFKAKAAITSPAPRAIWRLAVPIEVSTTGDYINAGEVGRTSKSNLQSAA
jgi:hypothetical protein